MVVSIDKGHPSGCTTRSRSMAEAPRGGCGQLEGSSDEGRRGWGEDLLHGRDGYGRGGLQSQNEVEDMRQKVSTSSPPGGIIREDLETKFKDSKDPSIVFVVHVWMTGLRCSQHLDHLLDKPMRNHTLMQTIARANRVLEISRTG